VATVVFGDFEWDSDKAASNLRTHGIAFEEALTALADPRAIEAPDLLLPERHVTIGMSALFRILFVVHTEHRPRAYPHHQRATRLACATEKV
jgi:uncharacterized DUF497 family protein